MEYEDLLDVRTRRTKAGNAIRKTYKKPKGKNVPVFVRALQSMVNTRQIVMALTPNTEIVLKNNSAVYHGYSSLNQLITAGMTVISGNATKAQGVSQSAGTSLSTSSNLNGDVFSAFASATASTSSAALCFGWRIRVTASNLNWAYRPFQLDVGPLTGAATTGNVSLATSDVVASFVIRAKRNIADFIVLSPTNAGGIFSVTAAYLGNAPGASATQTQNGFAVRSLGATDVFVEAESINMRDIMSRIVNPATSRTKQDNGFLEDVGYDEADVGYDDDYPAGEFGFAGVRDEL